MSGLGSEPTSLEELMKSGALSASSSVAPSSKSSVAPSSKSSVAPKADAPKVSTNLFKQIDDLNTQIKQETAKEKTLIGEPAKKQFDLVNTLIEKRLALQEQAGKSKTTMVEKAMKAAMDKNIGHEYDKDVESRYRTDYRPTIPTPWPLLNETIQGGWGPGDPSRSAAARRSSCGAGSGRAHRTARRAAARRAA
jgi:hypothetical protein